MVLPECIFSNTSKNIEEICRLLCSYDKQRLEKEAKINHEEAKKYLIDKIKKNRNDLISKVVLHIAEK